MEDLVMVESKDYAQVVFEDVKECYSENQDLECLFCLNDLLKADASDWIGIYKVGFSNYKEFFSTEQINLEHINENKGKVVFKGESLPKDDGEFYQFVYFSHSKLIRGASIPFQFKRAHLSDFIEVEEQEAVVIKSKESAINETITEIKSRCVHLTQANDTYEQLIKENEEIIRVLKEEVASVKSRCLRLTMDNEKLNFALRSKADNLKNLAETITNLTNENNKLQLKFDDLTNENKNLIQSLEHRISQVEQLKNDLETVKLSKGELENILNLKESELLQLTKDKDELNRIADDLQRINDQISKLEKQVDERVEELTHIKNDLKRNEAVVNEQAQTIHKILSERDGLNELIQKLTKEKSELECNQENLSQELNMSKDKLMAAEQCKEMLRAQLVVITEDLNEANAKIDKYLFTIKEAGERERLLNQEKTDLAQKMEIMKAEYEDRLQETNGSYFALKLAHGHLENRLKSFEQNKTKADKELEIYKQKTENLERENEELKERIKAGAKEYTKLIEKYRLLKNQQFNYDMNIYHDLNGDIHIKRDFSSHNNISNRTGSCCSDLNNDDTGDSAIQERTLSQSARGSSSIDNTLLDALLGSSFYNGWTNNSNDQRDLNRNINQQMANLNLLKNPQPQYPTITQPKIANVPNMISSQSAIDEPQNPLDMIRNQAQQLISLRNRNNYSNISKPVQDSSTSEKDNDVFELKSSSNRSVNMIPLLRSSSVKSGDDNDNRPTNITSAVFGLNSQSSSRSCDICNYIFPTDSDKSEIEKHYSLHYGPTCPICFLIFRKGYPQTEFENHVNTHFSN